jgi:hypothetical protein
MMRKSKESGYGSLLIELLICCVIGLTLLSGALVSTQQLVVAGNENTAWQILRALNKSEGFYYRVYGNGYVLPAVLANANGGAVGFVAPQSCDLPGLLGADYASEATLPGPFDGYTFTFTPGVTLTSVGKGCTNSGYFSYTVTATPVNRGNQTGMYFFTDQTGVVRYSTGGPANATSPILNW